MKNRVLLINCPNYDSDDKRRLRPLGICSLAAILRDHGYQCDIIDPNVDDVIMSIPNIIGEIEKGNYGLIGISSVTPNFHHAVDLAQGIKRKINTTVMLGGVHATFSHETIVYEYDCFDVIVRGEGELAILELTQDLFKNGYFTYPVEGCTYRSLEGKIHVASSINSLTTLDEIAPPVQDNIFNYSQTMVDGRLLKNISLISSRGCPYDCVFCSVTSLRRKWITRKTEDIANEVLSIYQKDHDIFLVYSDDNFFIDKNRAIDIIKTINALCGETINFCFATRTDIIVRHGMDALHFLKNNGCFSIELGVENGCDEVLSRMGKRNTSERNLMAIKMLNNAGIHIGVDYILFDPWTSLDEIRINIEFLKQSGLWGYFPPLLYVRMLPYPGTKLCSMMKTEYHRTEKLENYFSDKKTALLFDMLMMFKARFQSDLDRIIDSFKVSADKENFIDVIRLKMLPYIFLEKALVAVCEDESVFDKIVADINIVAIIQKMKVKYNQHADTRL